MILALIEILSNFIQEIQIDNLGILEVKQEIQIDNLDILKQNMIYSIKNDIKQTQNQTGSIKKLIEQVIKKVLAKKEEENLDC